MLSNMSFFEITVLNIISILVSVYIYNIIYKYRNYTLRSVPWYVKLLHSLGIRYTYTMKATANGKKYGWMNPEAQPFLKKHLGDKYDDFIKGVKEKRNEAGDINPPEHTETPTRD